MVPCGLQDARRLAGFTDCAADLWTTRQPVDNGICRNITVTWGFVGRVRRDRTHGVARM
jgi:hypothetical protein